MAHVKTAISLQKELFEQAEALADEMHVSRSHLFGLALAEFLRCRDNQLLLEQINAAYDDTPDAAEQALQDGMRRAQRRLVLEPREG